jgi:CubicO group peptidase (beta-lactamase class C family)
MTFPIRGGPDGKGAQVKRFVGTIFVMSAGMLAVLAAGPGTMLPETAGSIGQTLSPGQTPQVWEWPVSTPEAQGLDPRRLADLTAVIREGKEFPQLHALLIVRHGCLAVEEYFNDWQADRLHMLQSVSKSFTSALIGIAISRGEFKGVDEKVLDFFPEMKDIANMDERKASMRLRDLLTMRSGTDYHERTPDAPHWQLNRLLKGWDKFYLDRPMVASPGTSFNYDSGGVILLSAMLKNRTGMHADKYAERHLFGPLGIKNYFWHRNMEGHAHAGGGLNLTARDTARFGLLYLKNGRWGDKQVVPEEWVRESFRMHVDLTVKDQPPSGYGYLWWILAPDIRGDGRQMISAARGAYGQFIFVVPEHDLVVVINGDVKLAADRSRHMSLFYDRILPAVRR